MEEIMMDSLDRLINSLLDEKLATLDLKKELAELLGIQVNQIEFVELLTDELAIHQAVAICFNNGVKLHQINLQKIDFDYITADTEGRIVLVLRDEPL